MGRIDNDDTIPQQTNISSPLSRPGSSPLSRPYRPYRPYDEYDDSRIRNDSRFHRDVSVLSEVETQTAENVPPVQMEHWFTNHWRPAMAWLYFAICAFDFIAAPVFTFWFAYFAKIPYVPWTPLTLQGGGLIHVSLGAIIGVYTWSRTREKLAGIEDYGYGMSRRG